MARVKVTEIFSREEIAELTMTSNLSGARAVVTSWVIIAATLALLARFPHPLTFVLAVVVLGSRQLALAILMHEAAHRTLFSTRWLNDVFADWVCGRPIWGHVARYRKHHIAHHAHTGTARDPDKSLANPTPITRASLGRKLLRDVLFVSGLRRALGLLLMDLEVLEYNVSGDAIRKPGERSRWSRLLAFGRNAGGAIVTNAVLFGLLVWLGRPWLYSAWVVAWLTSYGLFLRIRALAEHACTDPTDNPFRNTRTTHAGLLARMTVAPLHVNLHLEHHLLVAVPWQRLPKMHAMLRARGALDGAVTAPGYMAVLREITTVSPARASSTYE